MSQSQITPAPAMAEPTVQLEQPQQTGARRVEKTGNAEPARANLKLPKRFTLRIQRNEILFPQRLPSITTRIHHL